MLLKTATFLVLTLSLFCSSASAIGSTRDEEPATLGQLSIGFSATIDKGFAVVRAEVTDVDVTDFLVLDVRTPGRVVVRFKDHDSRIRVQELLGQQENPHITLFLEDDGWVAVVYETLSSLGIPLWGIKFSGTKDIRVALNPCEMITAVVYRSIDAVLKRSIERAGQTGTPVTLDEVFALLLKGEIEPFIDRLEPIQVEHSCFKTFSLLNWLRDKQAQGFEFAGYRITDDLKGILGSVVRSLRDMQYWQRYQFWISVTGYTDDIRFGEEEIKEQERELLAVKTGVQHLDDPLRIFYAGCSGDELDAGEPVDIDFGSSGQKEVGKLIENNCELGAVRAYVALAFLRQDLRNSAVVCQYATGGIPPSAPKGKEDPLTRKVDIRFRVLAARDSQSP